MKLKHVCILAAVALLPAPAAIAQEKAHAQTETRQTIRDRDIYGYQMMTPQERERIRAEHHALMQERAKKRGVALPDAPPARGGMGPGAGTGPGGGMGRGK